MLTVWGRKISSNVQALMWCIGELGLPYQRHDIGHRYGGTDTDEFYRLNPNRIVLVLQYVELSLMSTFDYGIKVTNSMGCILIVGTKASAAAISIGIHTHAISVLRVINKGRGSTNTVTNAYVMRMV
ncbi:hypothetical protein MASR2M36_10670 [Providencia sp.]